MKVLVTVTDALGAATEQFLLTGISNRWDDVRAAVAELRPDQPHLHLRASTIGDRTSQLPMYAQLRTYEVGTA